MGKYNKRTAINKAKSTSAEPKGMIKKHSSKNKQKNKSKKIAAAEAKKLINVAKAKAAGGDAAMGPTIELTAGQKLVSFLEKAKNARTLEDALKKALRSQPEEEALGMALVHCAGRGFEQGVAVLLKSGAPVDAKDPARAVGRNTGLQLAASRGHVNSVKILVEAGADRTGALEASQELALLGAVFVEEKRAIQSILKR
jgi:hypothetical protein